MSSFRVSASIIYSSLLSLWGFLFACGCACALSSCLCPESECECHFMPVYIPIAIFLPIPSLLFLSWCVWVCLERQLLFLFLPLPYPLVCSSVVLPLSISVKSISASSCQSLPWDPGGLGLRFLFPLCPGLEELVLSEMNSPSRTQTGDSSSVSSFSYREILREKESSTIPARVRGKEEPTAPAFPTQILEPSFPTSQPSLTLGPAHILPCQLYPKLTNLDSHC